MGQGTPHQLAGDEGTDRLLIPNLSDYKLLLHRSEDQVLSLAGSLKNRACLFHGPSISGWAAYAQKSVVLQLLRTTSTS
jgi:hypothetical protein